MKAVLQRLSWSAVLVFLMVGSEMVPRAAAALPNIPPAFLAQLQDMSPAEQAELARQYGFRLPSQSGAMNEGDSSLGRLVRLLSWTSGPRLCCTRKNLRNC
jgi:hypothetical protein